MNQRKIRAPLGERLIRSVEGGLKALQNHGPLPLTEIPRPPEPEPLDQTELVCLRQRLHWSQAVLAIWLNVSSKTVQSWEQGTRKPSGSALRLLQLLEQPGLLRQLIPTNPEPVVSEEVEVYPARRKSKRKQKA